MASAVIGDEGDVRVGTIAEAENSLPVIHKDNFSLPTSEFISMQPDASDGFLRYKQQKEALSPFSNDFISQIGNALSIEPSIDST